MNDNNNNNNTYKNSLRCCGVYCIDTVVDAFDKRRQAVSGASQSGSRGATSTWTKSRNWITTKHFLKTSRLSVFQYLSNSYILCPYSWLHNGLTVNIHKIYSYSYEWVE